MQVGQSLNGVGERLLVDLEVLFPDTVADCAVANCGNR